MPELTWPIPDSSNGPFEMFIDIRVHFKDVLKSQTWPDGDTYEEWEETEIKAIEQINRQWLHNHLMRDIVDKIMESNDREKFINGLLAALHGEETHF